MAYLKQMAADRVDMLGNKSEVTPFKDQDFNSETFHEENFWNKPMK